MEKTKEEGSKFETFCGAIIKEIKSDVEKGALIVATKGSYMVQIQGGKKVATYDCMGIQIGMPTDIAIDNNKTKAIRFPHVNLREVTMADGTRGCRIDQMTMNPLNDTSAKPPWVMADNLPVASSAILVDYSALVQEIVAHIKKQIYSSRVSLCEECATKAANE
jgi:hypothetical protein